MGRKIPVRAIELGDIEHNDLINIQGGSSGQYYHLTAQEKTETLALLELYDDLVSLLA